MKHFKYFGRDMEKLFSKVKIALAWNMTMTHPESCIASSSGGGIGGVPKPPRMLWSLESASRMMRKYSGTDPLSYCRKRKLMYSQIIL